LDAYGGKLEVDMDIGMLWYDDDAKRPLDAKVASAAEYYKNKYGAVPTVCYVHPNMLPAERDASTELRVSTGVQLRPMRTVMINHFWLGVGDNTTGPDSQPRNGARPKKGKGAGP
jgi:hypothetical protein